MNEDFAAWLKARFGSEEAGAGTQAATPSTDSQPQPNVPYVAGSVPNVPPTTTTSNTHDARTEEELYFADLADLQAEILRIREHTQVNIPAALMLPTNTPPQQTTEGAEATYMQMSQPLEGAQLPSFTHNPVLNPEWGPIDDIQPLAGAQFNQGLPGDYHQGYEQTATPAELTRDPLMSTNIRLPDFMPRVPQPYQYRPSPIPYSTGITPQSINPPQAPDPKGPDPTYRDEDLASIALQLEAYNNSTLAKKGLLALRERLEAQKNVLGDSTTLLDIQLASQEHRNLALRDVQMLLVRRLDQNDMSDTLRGEIKLEIIKAECWIEWGKENNVDYSLHQKRMQDLSKILDLLGPEPEAVPSFTPVPDAEQQEQDHILNRPEFADDGLDPAPQVAGPIPLALEELDLSQIQVTENPNECHWCRDEQPWGLPGGIHFKPAAGTHASATATNTDDPDDDGGNYVSTMCGTCFAHRVAIGTHAQHGPFTTLPSRSADPHLAPGPKFHVRKTSCAVCPQIAAAICPGCPLRVCIGCQVTLERVCEGVLDRLLEVYGEAGRRNDAGLMGSGVARGERGEKEGEVVGDGGEEEEEEEEFIEGEFGRVWREIQMRDRGY